MGLWIQRSLVATSLAVVLWLLMAVSWLDRTLRPDRPFPRDPEQLRSRTDWLVATLRQAGALPGEAIVGDIDVVPYKTGEAFRSLVARVRVRYAVADEAAELRIIAKFAPRAESLRDHAVYILQGNHTKEAGVYAHLAADPDVAAPQAWFAESHALSGHFCILMADLYDAEEVTEGAGCPLARAALAMEAFAALHARFWGATDPRTDFLALVPDPFNDYLAGRVAGPDGALLGELTRRVWRQDNLPPTTVLHGDARVGNMLFAPDPHGEVVFIDWQAARLGKGVFDVAYFMTLSMAPEVRRSHGEALLARYHRGLEKRGVTDYPLATLKRHFRLASALVMTFVSLPMMSAESSDTGANAAGLRVLADVWTRRMVALAEDLDVRWVAAQVGMDQEAVAAAFARSNAATLAELATRSPAI